MSGAVFAFLSGFAVEALSVWWVHFSERGRVVPLGLCSAAQAVALSWGIGETHGWQRLIFVAGFSCGAMFAVRWKNVALR